MENRLDAGIVILILRTGYLEMYSKTFRICMLGYEKLIRKIEIIQ